MKVTSLYEFESSEAVVRAVQRRFLRFFRNRAPVLDIGCGRGEFLQLLRSAGIEGFGLDQSEEALRCCREKGLAVSQQEACSFLANGHEEGFGGIFCSHVLEHFDYEGALTLLRSCHRALRSDGTLVLVTPNPEDLEVIANIFWLDPTHVRPYPLPLLKRMLESTGFHVIGEEQFLGSWRLVGRRNLPAYFWRRILLGRYFGKPNTMVAAQKRRASRGGC